MSLRSRSSLSMVFIVPISDTARLNKNLILWLMSFTLKASIICAASVLFMIHRKMAVKNKCGASIQIAV